MKKTSYSNTQQYDPSAFLKDILKAAEEFENKNSFIFDETKHAALVFRQREDVATHAYSPYFHDVLKCIKNGEVENLKLMLLKPDLQLQVGQMSANPLRHSKYSFIVMLTTISRLAIESGLDSETSFTLSDIYAQKMDICETTSEVARVYVEMVYDYTHRIAAVLHQKNYSFITRRAMEYIVGHLHYQIRMDDVASYAGVTANYLSSHFKQNTQKTISQYILELRLTEAKELLRFTRQSIQEISISLGFSSPSYFAQQFRLFFGMSPKEYRKKYH